MYDNEFKLNGNKIKTKDKTDPQQVCSILHKNSKLLNNFSSMS